MTDISGQLLELRWQGVVEVDEPTQVLACQGSCALAVTLGICRDNGKENGNYIITGYILGLYGDNGFVWDVVPWFQCTTQNNNGREVLTES